MQAIVDFFNLPLFNILGGLMNIWDFLTILIILSALVSTTYFYAKGFIPVWIRLGKGLSKRKIAVFAEDEFNSLKSTLVDSGLFREANIVKINKNSIKKSKDLTLFLVHWSCFESEIEKILEMKDDSDALVIYAPQSEGRIGPAELERINNERNTIVVNFRGRLLNDILVSMITTGYKMR